MISNVEMLSAPPAMIGDSTFQFVVAHRYLVRQMLDEVKTWMEKREKELADPKTRMANQADQLVGEDSDAEKPHNEGD